MSGMAARTRILVAEDDEFVQMLLLSVLENAGIYGTGVGTLQGLRQSLVESAFDLVLLDLSLPDGNGLDELERLRAAEEMPIVVLTQSNAVDDRIRALELGADDYINKPVDPRELILRITRLLKISLPPQGDAGDPTVTIGPWTLDPGARTLLHTQRGEIVLTRSEFDLLAALFQAPNRVLRRDALLDHLDRFDSGPFDRTVDVLISRLRKKLGESPREPALTHTVPGVGYKLVPPVAISPD